MVSKQKLPKPKVQTKIKVGQGKVKKTKSKKTVVMEKVTVVMEKVTQKEVACEIQKKKNKYVMPSKSITNDLLTSCLNALLQLITHYKKKNTLFDDETPIFAEITCIKIQNSKGNIKFILPHSTVASTGEVCLITPDLKKGKKIDHEPTIDHWEELLRTAGVTTVKTVLPMRQLRVEYDQYELKRRLLTQHDFIMVDTRVLNHVSHLLGKMFFKKHNMLIPVRLSEDNLKKDIDKGLHTAMLRLSEGPTSTITVGHTGMPHEKLKDNVMSLIHQLCDKYPGGEINVRSLSLKLPLSLSLPLYITLRPTSSIHAPRLKQKKPKHFTVLEDELSTIPGSTVRVAPDGTVHLKKTKEQHNTSNDQEDQDFEEYNETESDE